MRAPLRVLLATALCGTFLTIASLRGQTYVQWPVGSGGNDHYYQLVLTPGGITWGAADTAAQAAGGYLATITSAGENTFVYGSLASSTSSAWFTDGSGNGEGPWLGGQQTTFTSEPAGGWVWVTGESWSFTNWASFEPSNGGGSGEEKLVFFGHGTAMGNQWNDVPSASTMKGYLVEFNSNPIPEPAATSSAIAAAAAAFFVYRRRTKTNARHAVD